MSSIITLTDAYKLGRVLEYPKDTTLINEVLVPRAAKYFESGLQELVEKHGCIVAGIQYAIKKVEEAFSEGVFNTSSASSEYMSILGKPIPQEFMSSLKALKEYYMVRGKLPLEYKWVEEGTLVPLGTPICTIENTIDHAFWLPNFVETLFLANVWQPMVNATKNFYLRLKAERYADKAADSNAYIDWQFHDFSMRGERGLDDIDQCSIGHLFNFKGSDTLRALTTMQKYYDTTANVLGSISAFEHSSVTTNIQYLMSQDSNLNLKEAEKLTLKHFITETYPEGLVAYVADSYDFWGTVDTLNELKDVILQREGKLVIRPDSGDPYKVICGLKVFYVSSETEDISTQLDAKEDLASWILVDYFGNPTFDIIRDVHTGKHYTYYAIMDGTQIDKWIIKEIGEVTVYEQCGLIQSLDLIFGHTINSKGYKVLNTKIGAVYGDAINFQRATAICERLMELGYSPENIVFGMGATWQSFNTRDNLGIALKTTKAIINGQQINVVKNPKTDSTKRSPKGDVFVHQDVDGNIKWFDADNIESVIGDNLLVKDNYTDLHTIRCNIEDELKKLL